MSKNWTSAKQMGELVYDFFDQYTYLKLQIWIHEYIETNFKYVCLCNVFVFSSTGFALNYELGKTYKYNYATQLQISEGKENTVDIVGLKLAAQADVAVVWQNGDDKILQFTVS